MITRSTIGRQKRRRKRQRAFALKETRPTDSQPQAYAYMCLHGAHATPSAVNCFLAPFQELGFLFLFFPSFSGLLMMSCTNRKSLNGFLLWVWMWCNWVERISFVGVGLMQLSRTDFFCGCGVWCNWFNSVNTCEFVVGEQFCNSWIQPLLFPFFLNTLLPLLLLLLLFLFFFCFFVFYLLGLITFHGPQQLSSTRVP